MALIQNLRAGSASATDGGSAPTPALPANMTSSDIMVALFYSREATDGTVSISSGWTQIVNDRSSGGLLAAWYRVFQTGDAAPTFTLGGHAGGGAGDTTVARVIAFSGGDTADILAITGTVSTNGSAEDVGPISGITPDEDEQIVFCFSGKRNDIIGAAGIVASTNFTELFENEGTAGADASIYLQYWLQTAATATGNVTVDYAAGDPAAEGKGILFSMNAAPIDAFCGFELGDSSDLFAQGTFSFSSTTKRSGDWALRCNPATTGTGFALVLAPLASSAVYTDQNCATLYGQFYFRYATGPSSNDEMMCRTEDASNNQKLEVRLNSAGKLAAYDSAASLLATGTTVLSANTWYRIQIKCGTGASAPWEVKINGATEISGTGNLLTTPSNSLAVGKRVNRNSNSVDFFYDDVIWGRRRYPPDGRVLRMDPNAAGDSAQWTTGTGSTFAEVDELGVPQVHDGDTSYIASSTGGNVSLFNLESASSAGISGTVNAVIAHATARDEGGTSGLFIRAVSGASGPQYQQLTARNVAATYGGQFGGLLMNNNIGSGGVAWTTTALDGLQVGVVNNVSVATRCTALCAMVHFTDSAIVALDTVSAVQTSTSGALAPKRGLTTTAAVATTTSAQIKGTFALVVTAAVATTTSAQVKGTFALVTTAAVQTATSGTLKPVIGLSTTAAVQTDTTAVLLRVVGLSAAATIQTDTTASLKPLVGISTAAVVGTTTSAQIKGTFALVVTAAVATTTSAQIKGTFALTTASLRVQTDTTASLKPLVGISTVAAVQTATTGTIARVVALSVTATIQTATTASLKPLVGISTAAAVATTTSAQIKGTFALVVTAAAATTTSAALKPVIGLSCAATIQTATTANLDVLGSIALDVAVAVQTATTGAIKGTFALATTAAVQTAASAALKPVIALSSAATIQTATTASLEVTSTVLLDVTAAVQTATTGNLKPLVGISTTAAVVTATSANVKPIRGLGVACQAATATTGQLTAAFGCQVVAGIVTSAGGQVHATFALVTTCGALTMSTANLTVDFLDLPDAVRFESRRKGPPSIVSRRKEPAIESRRSDKSIEARKG